MAVHITISTSFYTRKFLASNLNRIIDNGFLKGWNGWMEIAQTRLHASTHEKYSKRFLFHVSVTKQFCHKHLLLSHLLMETREVQISQGDGTICMTMVIPVRHHTNTAAIFRGT